LARNAVVIALPEQIDLSNAAGFAEKLTAAVSHEAAVIIDMSATRFCDCAGARAIVRAYKRATDSGVEVRLVVTAALVRRIFGLMGVDRLLDIYPSVAAAQAPDGIDSRAESAGPNPPYPAAARSYRPG
jgi:anti-sigma B factor antagonist